MNANEASEQVGKVIDLVVAQVQCVEVLELKQLIWDLSYGVVAQVTMKMRNVNEK